MADNVVFGQGGALLQIVNRDDQKFAMKCSAAYVDGKWVDVFKDPITDKGKQSKKGILKLVKTANGFETKRCEDGRQLDQMVVYYMNGTLLAEQTFDNIRERAAL